MKRRALLRLTASLAAIPLLPRVARAEGPAPAAPSFGRVVTRIGGNHGHVLTVSVAEVMAGGTKTYDVAGSASHGHAVTLGDDEWKRLRAGETVRMVSSREGGHKHRVLVRTAPLVDPPEAANVVEIAIGGKDDHELVITAADMEGKVDRTYDIQGVAGHTHALTVKTTDFARLAKGEELTITTGPGDGHAHIVFLKYPKAKKPG